MNANELLTKYELVIIIDAGLNNEEKDSIFKGASSVVTKSGGKVINSHVWFEKQKMTFRIKKCHEGAYYLINFEGDHACANKVRSELSLHEKILRFVITKAE